MARLVLFKSQISRGFALLPAKGDRTVCGTWGLCLEDIRANHAFGRRHATPRGGQLSWMGFLKEVTF